MNRNKGVDYMCENNENNNSNGNCISEILQIILVLQNNACPDNCLNSCDRPALGGGPDCMICNTRPVMLYTCCGNGTAWTMPTSKSINACTDEGAICSNVFRIEKLDGNCATFRVLAANTDATSTLPYVATDSFFTMDLSCACVIRCLNDTYIDCV